jgi:hypothetical protein
MPTSSRAPALLVLATLLAACSAPVTSQTAGTSASEPAVLSPTAGPTTSAAPFSQEPAATPQGTFPAMPGLSFDAAQQWAKSFQFTCQSGLFPPNRDDELLVALCTRQSAPDNATLDLTIQYWPNNSVLAVSAAVQPITPGSPVKADLRTAFVRWASELPYAGADAGKVLDWLLAKEDCSTGCALTDGDVNWTRTSTADLDAVSAFVPG